MRIERRFTQAGRDPYTGITFNPRTSKIVNPNGSVVFEMTDIMVPESWSQVAVDILSQKYFRKAGVAAKTVRIAEHGVPEWLQRSTSAEGTPMVGESDSRHVFNRLAGCWTYWGWKGGYFTSEADASTFYDESCHMLAAQMAAPNSPQWFNTGLHWAYGIEGPPQGHYFVDPLTKQMEKSTHAGGCHEGEIEWGRWVQKLVPSAEKVRFVIAKPGGGQEGVEMTIRYYGVAATKR